MRVIKRTGDTEEVSFDKVLTRLRNLSNNLNVDIFDVTQKVCSRIYDNVLTSELDELAAHICSSMIIDNPDYGTLASRIIISNHHKNTSPSFSETITILYNNPSPLIDKRLYDTVMKNKEKLNSIIDYSQDYSFDYFGFKTLEKAYLMRVDGRIVERPQQMLMRVSLGIHRKDFKDALDTYNHMSKKYFTHATPTLFNSGTLRPQLSSCFLLSICEDSISGIYQSLQECAMISKYAGGIGIHIHNVRSKNSKIRGTNGTSSGIIPMLRVFNNTARYVDQAGRRAGSIAVYLEPWHADIMDFLDLKKPHGHEEDRARDLFYALWIPDIFMERVKENGMWSLMCPDKCKGLTDVWGDKFKVLYESYEDKKMYFKQVKAQELWFKILESQIETGTPYLLYKDSANSKSNQQNLGTIKSSNLCVAPETMILTDKGYYPIIKLVEQEVNVWNGKEFSKTIVKQTGKMKKLMTISFDNNMKLRCTPYHKFYIEINKKPSDKNKFQIVEAQNLKLGMRIIRYSTPTINTSGEQLKYAYTHGLFCADGIYETHDKINKHQSNVNCCAEIYSDKPKLWLYGEKKKLINHIEWLYLNETDSPYRIDVSLPHDIEKKYFVPVNYNIQSKIKWLEGYIDGDGCIVQLNGIKNIQVSSIEYEFIHNIFYMLQTLGITSTISLMKEVCLKLLPDGKGGHKKYRLNIDCSSLLHLIELGFSPKRLDISDIRLHHHKTNKFVRISGIEDNGEYDDTYCFNEPLEHKGIFNGILTGNCSEIIEYSSPDEIAVCNLASICLPTYVETDTEGQPFFNFEKLHEIVKIVTKNLNKIIDVNFYPLEKARVSNLKHRPIGIGIQGLSDTFILMKLPFESVEASKLNILIAETMYHAAAEKSMEISKIRSNYIMESMSNIGHSPKDINTYLNLNEFEPSFTSKYPGAYSTFEGCPASQGKLQFDLWNVIPTSDRYDWDGLKEDIKKYGMRNSLLIALMPTASTSQIMGFNEAMEPMTSNIYKRKTSAGEFILVNKYLINDLNKLGLWNKDMKNKIIINEGSIQTINEIPQHLRDLYKIVWEMKQKALIDLAADRGAYVCQSQSMNLFVEDPDFKKLSSMHFYTWQKGLKTGIYYLRTKSKAKPQQFTMEPIKPTDNVTKGKNVVCKEDVCLICSS
jgi:ribonucleoside-diphosphate reductase alpha chain